MNSQRYTLLTFLPLSLLQQLKSVINVFYLCNGTLELFPEISWNNPLASFIPVGFVIIVGMIFEAVSDLRRWRSDCKINEQQVTVVDQRVVNAADLQVGQVIELESE